MNAFTITITTVVDEKRRIMIDLPDDVPLGKINLTIQANMLNDMLDTDDVSHKGIQAKLIAAGLVSPSESSPDAIAVSNEELERLGHVFADDRPLSELIDKEREDRI